MDERTLVMRKALHAALLGEGNGKLEALSDDKLECADANFCIDLDAVRRRLSMPWMRRHPLSACRSRSVNDVWQRRRKMDKIQIDDVGQIIANVTVAYSGISPALQLRYVVRHVEPNATERILQQKWDRLDYNSAGRVIGGGTEWRDVPLNIGDQ